MIARCRWMRVLPVLLALVIALAVALPAAAQGQDPVVFVNVASLHQRTGPGMQYAIQGTLGGGMMLPVVGRTADSSWWEVESRFGIGWVNGEHVLTRGNFSRVPVVTEFGIIGRPNVLVFGEPIPVYALPNAASRVLGLAPSEAQYPAYGQTYHATTETWYWLIGTEGGSAWVRQSDVAVVGDASTLPIIDYDVARGIRTAAVSATGVVHPPVPTPVPSAPTAPPPPIVVVPTFAPQAAPAVPAVPDTQAAAPVVVAPTAPDTLRISGDCYALPLVSFLVLHSPVTATSLRCLDSNAGRDLVILGQADLGMVFGNSCGTAVQVAAATVFDNAGVGYDLNFCVSQTPTARTQLFLNWLASEQGAAAIRLYRGLPNLAGVPVSAQPR